LKIDHLFSTEGLLAASKAGYELRSGQVEMALAVEQALNDDGVLVVEAGTGIGKSFAYLVPALLWCADHEDERIVIATSAIPLQHQLLEKDIPFLINTLNLPLSAAVLKGRGNYLCMRRLEQQMQLSPGYDAQHRAMLQKIFLWTKTTHSGDRAELPFHVPQHIWRTICSTPETCIGYHCRNRDGCYVQQARKRATDAQIIIVNHHLLFASMQMNNDDEDAQQLILPEFDRLIIDEAHNIERNAVSYFTQSYDPRQLQIQLHNTAGMLKGRPSGIVEKLRSISSDPVSCDAAFIHAQEVIQASDACTSELEKLFNDLDGSRRVLHTHIDNHIELSLAGAQLIDRFHEFAQMITDIIRSCPETPETVALLYEAQASAHYFTEQASLISHLISCDLEHTHVTYLEQNRVHQNAPWYYVVRITPISFSEMLARNIFERYKSVVCTSATLTVKKTFTYWEKKVGLDELEEGRYQKMSIDSPFDYRNRVMLALAGSSPNPSDYQSYFAYSADAIIKMIRSLEGGALVLFTSHAMLESMYEAVKPEMEKLGITLYKQGDEDRYKLMKQFIDQEHSVLMATQSFWEGVDAPGATLRLLIICRLPFQSPADPLFAAKAAKLEEQGASPFMELSLPEAVIRMKQGYGRLMRSSTDRGIVCVLDSRIITKRYGNIILASLPKTLSLNADIDTLIERMEDFYYAQKR
jgi:ATP-dependent DNA helicase DinG